MRRRQAENFGEFNAPPAKAPGPVLNLVPFETRRIDVAALQDGKTLPQNAQWTSVTMATSGLPDEVMAVAARYDQSLHYGAQTPFSDQLAVQWEGGMWQYDPQHDSIITAGNGSSKPTQVAFTIFYNQGTQKYELDQTLQPGDQIWMDIGKLIRESVLDKNGNTLPASLTSGSYAVRDLCGTRVGTLFEGKVIYDKTYGHVTYGCAACCGWGIPYPWFNPLPVPITLSVGNGEWASYPCDNFIDDVSYNFYNNWSSGSTSIATVDYMGTTTGVGLGSTSLKTNGYLASNDAHNDCPLLFRIPTGSVNVGVYPQILLGGSSGTNITNTTQSVVAGQQIILYGKYALPSGFTFTSLAWTIPGTGSNPPTAISNFTYAPDFSTGGPVFLTTAQLGSPSQPGQQQITYYFVAAANSQSVIFTLYYTVNGTAKTATAQTTFNIAGPTSAGLQSNPTLGQFTFTGNGTTGSILVSGSLFGTPGISFFGKAISPSQDNSGTYEWDQIIIQDYYSYTIGTTKTTCNGPVGLDNEIPTVQGFIYSDSPGKGLPAADNQFTWTWSSTIFMMWNPGLANSIRIPLGYVSWNFYGDAVQNISTNSWTLQTDSTQQASAFTVSSVYPNWNSKVTNGNGGGCP